MTSREKMLENVMRHNSDYTDMFIMSVAMHGDQPVIQGFFEGRVLEGEKEPASLNIGGSVLAQLHKSMLGSGNKEEDEDGETRH